MAHSSAQVPGDRQISRPNANPTIAIAPQSIAPNVVQVPGGGASFHWRLDSQPGKFFDFGGPSAPANFNRLFKFPVGAWIVTVRANIHILSKGSVVTCYVGATNQPIDNARLQSDAVTEVGMATVTRLVAPVTLVTTFSVTPGNDILTLNCSPQGAPFQMFGVSLIATPVAAIATSVG